MRRGAIPFGFLIGSVLLGFFVSFLSYSWISEIAVLFAVPTLTCDLVLIALGRRRDAKRVGGIAYLLSGVSLGLFGYFAYFVGTMCITSAPTDCSGAPLSPLAVSGVIATLVAGALLVVGTVMLATSRVRRAASAQTAGGP